MKTRPEVGAIKLAACAKYGVTLGQLNGRSRHREIVRARQFAMYLCRGLGMSYPAIGRVFGGRHHTTVMWAVAKTEADQQIKVYAVPLS